MKNNELESKYKIDKNKIKVGQVFPNKKAMCKYLGQEYIPRGNVKKSQEKEWKRYIDWEKDGNKIIITDIYDKPLDKNDGRIINGTQMYQRYIEDILLAYFDSALWYSENELKDIKEKDILEMQLTLNQILLLCGMVNENYTKKNIKGVLVEMNYTPFNINDFFSRTKTKFRKVIDNALANMYKRRIITYQTDVVVVEKDKHRLATIEEQDEIVNAEKEVLKDMGYESIVNVYLSYTTDEYYKRLNKYLKENFGWDSSYKCYTIRVNRLRINLEKEFLENTHQQNKLILNKRLTEFFNTQAKQKVIKSNNKEMGEFRLPSDYRSQQKSLSDYLLNIE